MRFDFCWRRRGDSNPRTLSRLLVFETSPFSLLGTSPCEKYYSIVIIVVERNIVLNDKKV